jgi:hypothetical protein
MTEPLARIAEADAAKAAWERFVGPALATVRADYMAKLTDEAIKPMEGRALQAVQNLSIGLRIADLIEGQIRSLMLDGAAAQKELDRASDLARLSPEQRRYAQY